MRHLREMAHDIASHKFWENSEEDVLRLDVVWGGNRRTRNRAVKPTIFLS